MQTQVGEVKNDKGESKPAQLAVCDCGFYFFAVFQIDGDNHQHLQCGRCNKSYCPAGACDHDS